MKGSEQGSEAEMRSGGEETELDLDFHGSSQEEDRPIRSDLEEGFWCLGSIRWRREEEDGAVEAGGSDLRDCSSSSRSSILSWILVGFLLNISE